MISGNRILFLIQKELRSYFLSPMVYILSGLFILLMGGIFFNTMMISKDQQVVSLDTMVLPTIFGNMNFIFLVVAPLVSMRLLAEEKKQRTLPLLLTSSLTHLEIILGKLLASFLVMGFMTVLTLIFPIILCKSGDVDITTIAISYGGTLLNILCFLSVGLFTSSLTENQIVSALMSFCILFIFLLLAHAPFVMSNFLMGQIFYYLSLPLHFEPFSRGVIRSMDLIYYFSAISFMTFLTHESLESRHW